MKFKLKYKILLLYTTVSLCVLISIGVLLTRNLRREKFEDILDSLQDQLTHIDFAISGFFGEIEDDLKDFTANPSVISRDDKDFTNFTEADEGSFQYRIGNKEQKIIDIFNRYKNTHTHVNSVYMGRANGSFVRSHKRDRPTKYDPRTRPWYILGEKYPKKIVKTAPYSSLTSLDVNIGVATALLDRNGEVYGVVGIDVTLEDLTRYVENITVGRQGYLLLVDKEGTIVASRQREHRFMNISVVCRDDIDLLFEKPKGIISFSNENQKNYLIFKESPALGWKIAFVIPVAEIDQEVRSFVIKIISALAVSLGILSLLTVLGLEKFVLTPLGKLNNSTQRIAHTGDLEQQIDVRSSDEIGTLAASFNKMTRELKTHINKLMETTAARERFESELKIAHDIQMGILPKTFPPFPGRYEVDIYAVIEPAKEVGGDLYDFFFVDENRMCFVIGDVSGKGVPAAVFMSAAKMLIKATAKSTDHPGAILDFVNKELAVENEYGTFVTVFLGFLNVETGEVKYCNAGHNPPLLLSGDGQADFITGGKSLVVGVEEDAVFRSDTFVLQPGDGIFLYTDGVTEAFNTENEPFSEEKLKREVALGKSDSLKGMVTRILKDVQSHSAGQPQSDDITILALRYFPGGTNNMSCCTKRFKKELEPSFNRPDVGI